MSNLCTVVSWDEFVMLYGPQFTLLCNSTHSRIRFVWLYLYNVSEHTRVSCSDVRNRFFISVRFRFGFHKKTRIRFGMSLVQFGLDIIVIFYSCNSKYYSDSG